MGDSNANHTWSYKAKYRGRMYKLICLTSAIIAKYLED
jgi:hypothetical protein